MRKVTLGNKLLSMTQVGQPERHNLVTATATRGPWSTADQAGPVAIRTITSQPGFANISRWNRVSPPAQTAMIIELMRDDAAAVYVNGVEVLRSNLPGVLGDNAVTAQTLASAVATTADESTFQPPETRDLTLQQYRNLLRDGDNVIAVEVHQNDANSSDVTFDLRMSLTVVVSGGVLGNDTEPDGQAMTAVLGVGPVHGTLEFYPNGTFTYTPDPLYYGPDSFTYRATDGTLFSAEATVTIDVRHLPPVAGADSFATDEDTPLVIDAANGVLANDADTQDHILSVQLIATTEHGVLTLAADGSFSYVPDENFHGSDEFTYRATDGQLQSEPVVVTITVRSIDDPAVAVDDAYEVSSGGTLTVDFPRSLGGPIPGGSRATPLAAGGQMIYDRHRDILYRIGSGTIQRYQVLTNTLLAPYSVPTTVTEGDISPDGRAVLFRGHRYRARHRVYPKNLARRWDAHDAHVFSRRLGSLRQRSRHRGEWYRPFLDRILRFWSDSASPTRHGNRYHQRRRRGVAANRYSLRSGQITVGLH